MMLKFNSRTIISDEGVQLKDILGPLLFFLTIYSLLQSLSRELVIGYMDNSTLGGPIDNVAIDVTLLKDKKVFHLVYILIPANVKAFLRRHLYMLHHSQTLYTLILETLFIRSSTLFRFSRACLSTKKISEIKTSRRLPSSYPGT